MERKGKKEGKIFDTKEDGKSFMIYRDLRDFFFIQYFKQYFSLVSIFVSWYFFEGFGYRGETEIAFRLIHDLCSYFLIK